MAEIDGTKVRPGTLDAIVGVSGESSSIIIGVVEEIIYHPENFIADEEVFAELKERMDDPKIFSDIPANSLLVRIITAKEYKNSGKLTLCHPLFPQHIQLPIKVGEHVFMFKYGKLGYWLARVPDVRTVEDVNYVHGDRRHLHAPGVEGTIDQANSADGSSNKLIGIFNNGGGAEDNLTFSPDDSYEKIFETTKTNDSVTREPVPFFLKRPGDLVLQGSNNSLICLGQNRGWKKSDDLGTAENSNVVYTDPLEGSGAIDIVVGRGRYLPDAPGTEAEDGDDPVRTATRISENTDGVKEADRASVLNFLDVNKTEGDPDYEYDAARINITMKASYDDDFHIIKDAEGTDLLPTIPAWPDGPETGLDGNPVESVVDASYSLTKADEIRIIARHQLENMNKLKDGVKEIKGSIKIIKEGVRNAEDGTGQAVIIMQSDGTIMIDGPTIIIGSGHKDLEKENGAGTQIILGRGAEEPLVLGTTLKDLLDAHFNDIKGHLDNLKTHLSSGFNVHIHPTGVGPSGPPAVPAAAFAGQIDGTKSAIDGSIKDLVTTLSKYGKLK